MSFAVMQFGLSLLAVIGLCAAVHLAGFSQPAMLASEAEARALARLAPGGFAPAHVAMDQHGRAALLGEAGEGARGLLLLRPLGGRFVPEEVPRRSVRLEHGRLLVASEMGVVTLDIAPETAARVQAWLA